jgi:uncharacterized protein YqeY
MSLIARLESELTAAMKERDTVRRDALRLILSSLRAAEKELQRPLHDDEELQVLQRERKRRLESIEAFRGGGREDRAAKEEAELEVLEEFMPEPLSEEELERIVDDAIAEVGATSMRDLGRVMADVMPQIAGRADGSAVSQLVREKLA